MDINENLSIQWVEYDPKWEDTDHNLNLLNKILSQDTYKDVIILPEMFNTGFSMNTHKIAEPMDGKTIQWMQEFSLTHNSGICGSLAILENNKFYNRFVFIAEGKVITQYDKHHLFSYGGESLAYTSGKNKIIFNYKGWKICPMICFDLRFPVWNRNTEDYDLMINVASWPDARLEVWDTLLKARAIENVAYVCGVNRIGTDGLNLHYSGHSITLSPIGKIVESKKINDFLYQTTLSKAEIKKWREKYNFLGQRDPFQWI